MMQEMRKAFDEAIEKFENVETFVLVVGNDKMQFNHMTGKIKKAFAHLIMESAEFMEIVEDALKTAKMQIKINELVAEAKKLGITLPGMDDEDETKAEVEAEEKRI